MLFPPCIDANPDDGRTLLDPLRPIITLLLLLLFILLLIRLLPAAAPTAVVATLLPLLNVLSELGMLALCIAAVVGGIIILDTPVASALITTAGSFNTVFVEGVMGGLFTLPDLALRGIGIVMELALPIELAI